MTRKHTRLSAFLCLVAALACCLALSGCAIVDKSDVKQLFRDGFEALQAGDSQAAALYAPDMQQTFSTLGVDSGQFFAAFLADASYKIKRVELSDDGESATLFVEVTAPSFHKVVVAYNELFVQWVATEEGAAAKEAGDTEVLYAKAGQFLSESVGAGASELVTSEGVLVAAYVDGQWTVSDATQLTPALLGGYVG